MTDLKLEVEIINREKQEISKKRKTTLFSVFGGLWLSLIYSQRLSSNNYSILFKQLK